MKTGCRSSLSCLSIPLLQGSHNKICESRLEKLESEVPLGHVFYRQECGIRSRLSAMVFSLEFFLEFFPQVVR